VLATGFLGGHAGRYVELLLQNDGIASDFTYTEGETRTCINFYDETTGTQTEFLEPGEPVTQEDWQVFLKKFTQLAQKSDVITISGSVPKGLGEDASAQLVRIARTQGKPVLLDSSGAQLTNGIAQKPTLIKPNGDEIQALLGGSEDTPAHAAKRLHAKGIDYAAVSLGKNGALLGCSAGLFYGKPPAVQAVNTVGCGDSMIAAFAVALQRGYAPEELLRFAVAVSAAAALHPETGRFDPADFERLYPQVTVEQRI
jgi:tagatose 6-phosphate kinase